MTQQQEKIIIAYQLLGSTVLLTSRSWTGVNKTNQTYQNFVAKIQVYMSNKTQILSLLGKSGSYKNMLKFMEIV